MLSVITVVSISIINLAYTLEGSFQRLGDFRFCTSALSGAVTLDDNSAGGGNRFSGSWIGLLPVPLPKNYVQGLDVQLRDFEKGMNSYLRGSWADHGWWYYYLYSLAIKEPLGMWGLVALAIATSIFGAGYSTPWRDEMAVLAPFFSVLILVSSQTGFSAHSRYVIPALPFLFIWTSKVAQAFEVRPFSRRRTVMAVMVALAFIWSTASSLAVYPHSLSYFNELAAVLPTPADASYPRPIGTSDEQCGILSRVKHALTAGSRNGPRHLLNSNIDWSQDLFYLRDWLIEHPNVNLDGLDCFGCCPTTLADIPATPLPASGRDADNDKPDQRLSQYGPKAGWYAVSVNRIYSRERQYRYFLYFKPFTTAGYSIYIYHITIDDANRVRRELGLPELPTSGPSLPGLRPKGECKVLRSASASTSSAAPLPTPSPSVPLPRGEGLLLAAGVRTSGRGLPRSPSSPCSVPYRSGKRLGGEATCGCFGSLEVSPRYTMTMDWAFVAALIRFRPQSLRPRRFPPTFSPLRVGSVAVIWAFVGGPVGYAMASFQPTTLSDAGSIIGGGNVVVLEPEKWVGKRIPLLNSSISASSSQEASGRSFSIEADVRTAKIPSRIQTACRPMRLSLRESRLSRFRLMAIPAKVPICLHRRSFRAGLARRKNGLSRRRFN